ncbi:hypothetical protein AB0J86_28945 [Micromonospora sp. NPDC049559]|uniref:hypothetical protein n=1 Tax=Micromonospora sp. NPDC049559 TaxID=3155923 RepID=UPI0034257C8D
MSTDAPAYPRPTGEPDPSPARSRQRWLIVAVAGWAVLLLVLAYVSLRHDAPTVREQRDLAEAAPVVDRAVGALAAAAAADPDVVVELRPPRLARDCRVTPVRAGATLERDVVVRAAGADADALLRRIAERLPADYRAGTRGAGEQTRLRADAGEFVGVEGRFTAPGTATLSVDTGCRPEGPPQARVVGPAGTYDVERTAGRVLGALGGTAGASPERITAPCPGGGTAYTARLAGSAPAPGSLAGALRPLAGPDAVVVTDEPDRYAYRSGPLSVLAEAGGGEIRVAATTACG